MEEVPEHCYLLMRLIKMYEKETVEAVQEQSEGKSDSGADAASADQFPILCQKNLLQLTARHTADYSIRHKGCVKRGQG